MVDLNNNTRRGQLSKKEAQSHRGGEGGRERETKSDSGGEKTFGGVMGWDVGERGWKRANGWEEAKRGTDEWKGPKKSVSLLRQLSMTIEASGWGGRKGRRDSEQKSQRWALRPVAFFPGLLICQLALGLLPCAEPCFGRKTFYWPTKTI